MKKNIICVLFCLFFVESSFALERKDSAFHCKGSGHTDADWKVNLPKSLTGEKYQKIFAQLEATKGFSIKVKKERSGHVYLWVSYKRVGIVDVYNGYDFNPYRRMAIVDAITENGVNCIWNN